MSGDVIAFKDLQVASAGEILDFTFFNKRFLEVTSAINGIAARQDIYDSTENTLVATGLSRVNDVLGPLLLQLQAAAQYGFLVANAVGPTASLTVGIDIQFTVTSQGKSVFTPTPWVLATDNLDSTNWGLLSLNAYSPTTGVFAGHCVYATKTQASTQWTLSCNSAVITAMMNLLASAQTAANTAVAAESSVVNSIGDLQTLINIVSAGPVASVAGKTGAVTLATSDIIGLDTALLGKASVASLSSKQDNSALLTAFATLTFATDKLAYSTGSASLGITGFTALARALLACTDAASMRAVLGLGTAALSAATDFAPAAVPSGTVAAQFDDQVSITTYTFASTDSGRIVTLSNVNPITATLPNNLPKGWNCLVYQGNLSQVTFVAASGATMRNRLGNMKTAGQYAVVSLLCVSNVDGGSAVYVLGGDTSS
jgi:hypothetical protein